jgi:putative transposase
MIRAHRIRLVPTLEQEVYFRRACGVARFACNWALAEWKRQYDAGAKPSEVALRKAFNAIKHDKYPWMCEVTKNAPQQAIKNLGRAYANFFDDPKKYRCGETRWNRVRVPTFKKKGQNDRFRADNGPNRQHPDAVGVCGTCVQLPIIGRVVMREAVRFVGRIRSVTISARLMAGTRAFRSRWMLSPAFGLTRASSESISG